MIRRNIALFVLIALASMTVSDWSQGGSLSAKAGQSSNVPRPQQKPANSIPQTIWEYKLLYATTSQLASLEGEINDYARDGFVVDSFQAVSNISGDNGTDGPVRRDSAGNRTYDNLFQISSTSVLIVLLKRIKR
jgi:hypothetical protein